MKCHVRIRSRNHQEVTVDLHGFEATVAKVAVAFVLGECRRPAGARAGGGAAPDDGSGGAPLPLRIITGRGQHSKGGMPILKPAIIAMLAEVR